MTHLFAIDPGSIMSGWVELDGTRVLAFGKDANETVLGWLRIGDIGPVVVIEDLVPRQQPLGREVADTLRWIGRFMEAASRDSEVHLLTRQAVTAHLIDGGTKDADKRIRAALIDRFGGAGGKHAAVGTKAAPGPLHGVLGDVWQALALAVTWQDLHGEDR